MPQMQVDGASREDLQDTTPPVTKKGREAGHCVDTSDDISEEGEEEEVHTIHRIGNPPRKGPLWERVVINRNEILMEVDTGVSVSVIGQALFKKLWKRRERPGLRKPHVTLKTYSGETLEALGEVDIVAKCEGQTVRLSLLIIKGNGPNLMGREWLAVIKLHWNQLLNIQAGKKYHKKIIERYADVFKEELCTLQGTTAALHVDPQAKPRFCKARLVPYAFKEKIENALDRVVEEGTLEPVQFSRWAAPIVPILKSDGSVRIYGDYQITVNQVLSRDQYPVPKIENLFSTLAGGNSSLN